MSSRLVKMVAAQAARLRTRRRGFTLLEVMLAMSIAAVIIGALVMAIDLQLRVVDQGRREVENAQLARALLGRMADDLRSTVRYQPVDVEALLPETSTAGSLEGAMAGLGQGGPSAGGASAELDDESLDSADDMADSAITGSVPGLYGNQYELQVDVSRLPRVDQYAQLLEADETGLRIDRPSDVKTVAYYVTGATSRNSLVGGVTSSESGTGLVRRQLDRAATTFAAEQGDYVSLEEHQELLAPEVVAVEFRYFDGTEWLYEWDSTERDGVPVAVEIALAIAAVGQDPAALSVTTRNSSVVDLAGSAGGTVQVYRLLVHLPAGTPTTTDQSTSSSSQDTSASEEETSP